jgi:class 3 adenylate cyclase/tetratricopeptide (TPR) repeat protein
MQCTKCHCENPETKKFCRKCGTKLVVICPNCKSDNDPESSFCGDCGHNLILPSEPTHKELSFDEKLQKIQKYLPRGLAEKVLAQRDKIEGERKQVTVLFCDMKGFTPLSEKLGPDTMYSVMDQVYEILMRQVHDFGGTVNEMTGDGIMALFGAPVALEEAPQRAIRASLSIHQELAKLSDTLHKTNNDLPPIRMRIGIHTGPVVVGSLGDDLRVEFKAVGDTVVLAARLEQIAEAGQTYVSRDVFRATEGYFLFDTLEPTMVKGKTEPIQVYRVTGTKESPERSVGIGSPLVGREKELDILSLQVLRLINGMGGIVTITGEAGIGKSRLMAELRRTEMIKKVLLLEGKALSIGRSLSFYPIIDALKQWSRIREEDTDTEAQRKLEKTIRMIHPEEVNEVFPFIATLMGMKLTGEHAERMKGIAGESLEKLIFKNVREIIIKGSELRPTVIYIEDFHWVDTSSLELIEALFRLVEEFKILFILVFRPGYADTGERILKSIEENYPSHWTKIELEALNETESQELLSNLLRIKGLPLHIREQILQRAGGNPFFLEEVVRSLIDEGAVVLKNGDYQVTEKITQVVIPQSIHALIMTRIDKLDEETRNLIRMASVIGRNFFYRILTEVASTIEEIDRRLDHLKEIQLIRERKRMEELEYLFKHALAQEAAYESILIQRRKELHNKVARSIEKVFNERLPEFYGMLSYHYSMGGDLDKAEEYMIKAGEEAMKSAASSEALDYFQEALSIYRSKFGEKASPEKIAMLEKNIAHALLNRGRYLESADYFTRVLEYHGESFPKTRLGIAMKLTHGLIHLLLGLYLPVLKWRRIPTERDKEIIHLYYNKGLALVQPDPKRMFIETIFLIKRMTDVDISRVQNGYGTLASFSTLFSWTGISRRISKKILDFTKNKIDHHDGKAYASYLFAQFFHDFCMGDFVPPDPELDSLTDRMIKGGELALGVFMTLWPRQYFLENGQFVRAIEAIERFNTVYREYNQDMAGTMAISFKARVFLKQRRLKEALRTFHEGITFVDKKASKNLHFLMHALTARTLLLSGEIKEARDCFEYLETIRGETPLAPYYLSDYLIGRFMFALHTLEKAVKTGDASYDKCVQEARLWGKESLKVCKKFNAARVEAMRHMGTFHWLTGKKRDALKWWRLSIETGERFNMQPELSRTYFEIGKRLSEPNSPQRELNGISAAEYLNKAKTMFEEMDLKWDLEQLERVMEKVA